MSRAELRYLRCDLAVRIVSDERKAAVVAGTISRIPRGSRSSRAAWPGSAIRDTRGDRIFNAFNYVVLSVYLADRALPAGLHRQRLVQQPGGGDLGAGPALAGRADRDRLRDDLQGSGDRARLSQLGLLRRRRHRGECRADAAGGLSPLAPRSARPWRIMFFFFFTTLFSGGLIPTYLVVRDLGLLNTRWALILPAALSVWNVIITRTYFQTTFPVSCSMRPGSTARAISASCATSSCRSPVRSWRSTPSSTRSGTGTPISTR